MDDTGVVALLSRLIRFDTTNHGHGRSAGETACATWITDRLRQAGYAPVLLHRDDAPERGNVVVRVPGSDPSLPGLVVHGHLDVVPAVASEWSVDPFGGVVRDGYVYGRGAVDMKDMVACMLATLLAWAATGTRPRRDTVLAFVADEEDAGQWGAAWLTAAHPELFTGCEAAIGEEGGQVYPTLAANGEMVRLYPVAVAERGTLHARLVTRGPPGTGPAPPAATRWRRCWRPSPASRPMCGRDRCPTPYAPRWRRCRRCWATRSTSTTRRRSPRSAGRSDPRRQGRCPGRCGRRRP